MVGGKLQRVAQPCLVHNQRSFADADPLRRGSFFCHRHRKQCEGWVRAGDKCCLSSSSEHVHAEPLKRGEAASFCGHHADQDSKRGCDACWQVVASEAGLEDADARVPGPVKAVVLRRVLGRVGGACMAQDRCEGGARCKRLRVCARVLRGLRAATWEFLKHTGLEQVDAVGGSETLRMM